MNLRNSFLFNAMGVLTTAAALFLSATVIFKIKPVTSRFEFQPIGLKTLEKLESLVLDSSNVAIALAVLVFSIYCMLEIKRYQTA